MSKVSENAFEARILAAETERELGNIEKSLALLKSIRSEASVAKAWQYVAAASGHIVLCYKHLFQNTSNPEFLSMMAREIESALDLPIEDTYKATFWLRKGDVEVERGQLDAAESYRKHACELVEKNTAAEAECLGHLAEIKAAIGKCAEAGELLLRATSILHNTSGLRAFRRTTLECGLLARQTKLELTQKRYVQALWCFARGYRLAWVYKLRYGMGQRILQYHKAVCEIARTQKRTRSS